jgi:large subunit ribosomal protein L6
MSRIGKKPVVIPSGVQVQLSGNLITVQGPKGELKEYLHSFVKAEVKDGQVILSADLSSAREVSALYGLMRSRVQNMVEGASKGFSKVLDIVGLGFRAEVAGQKMTLALGKSHPVIFEAPHGIVLSVDPKKTQITVSGISKDLVGEIAAKIRGLREPEPYKGTGIRYQGEHVRRKAGKTAAGASAGAAGAKK